MFGYYVKNSIGVVALACCVMGVIYGASLMSSGERSMGTLETIHGIPYSTQNGSIMISEKLAHADIFIDAPVFAKNMTLAVQFDPGNATSIDVGVRMGSFWLGYDKKPLYRKGVDARGDQVKTVTFPLTAAFQATNQSIDIMLFSEATTSTSAIEEADRDTVLWSVRSIHATVYPVLPTMAEGKDYLKSIWNRERDI